MPFHLIKIFFAELQERCKDLTDHGNIGYLLEGLVNDINMKILDAQVSTMNELDVKYRKQRQEFESLKTQLFGNYIDINTTIYDNFNITNKYQKILNTTLVEQLQTLKVIENDILPRISNEVIEKINNHSSEQAKSTITLATDIKRHQQNIDKMEDRLFERLNTKMNQKIEAMEDNIMKMLNKLYDVAGKRLYVIKISTYI